MDKKKKKPVKKKQVKKNGNKTTKPVNPQKQRRGIKTTQANPSTSNISKNLKGFYNNLISPLLGTPKIQLYNDARKLEVAKYNNMINKVYKEGERIPQTLHKLDGMWYGDGSGRTWKEGGRAPCRDRYDGQRVGTTCNRFRVKKGQKFVEGKGFIPRFVNP
jgi:hypothetical protein